MTLKPISEARLYAFVDTAYLHGRSPAQVARQLCDGGADLIQLRAKDRSLDEIRGMAMEILPITRSASVPLVLNDHFDLAREMGAEFCHLGQEDFFDAGHKHTSELVAGQGSPLIGLSTHAPEQAARAVAAAPAYVAIGPVYATGTKATAKPVTLEYVRWAAAHVSLPWFAIGGINLDTIDAVLSAGARRVCVVSAILNSPDPAAACREFKRRLS